jgi:Helix-turn-helix domain/ParB-like nuclease domain
MHETLQLFPSLPQVIEDALRASIQRFGVLVPVMVDQHGRILDGHHRARIAGDLGVGYRTQTYEVHSDDDAREIAHTLNADRRQLTPEQRQEVAVALRQEGHSYRAIGGALGVSDVTIMHDVKHAAPTANPLAVQPERVIGLDGKSRPATRPPTMREALAARPSPEEARARAKREGRVFLDNTGHWQSGSTDEDVQHRMAYHALLKALEVLAKPPGPPERLVQMTPEYWRDDMARWLPAILDYVAHYAAVLQQTAPGASHGNGTA